MIILELNRHYAATVVAVIIRRRPWAPVLGLRFVRPAAVALFNKLIRASVVAGSIVGT